MKQIVIAIAAFSVGIFLGSLVTGRAIQARETTHSPLGAVNLSMPVLPPPPIFAPSAAAVESSQSK